MSETIRISVTNEILKENDSTFATINAGSIDDITMDNCRNVVAKHLAEKAFKEGGKHSDGMWSAELIPKD